MTHSFDAPTSLIFSRADRRNSFHLLFTGPNPWSRLPRMHFEADTIDVLPKADFDPIVARWVKALPTTGRRVLRVDRQSVAPGWNELHDKYAVNNSAGRWTEH